MGQASSILPKEAVMAVMVTGFQLFLLEMTSYTFVLLSMETPMNAETQQLLYK